MFTTRPEIAGTFGVVTSTHWLASQVGTALRLLFVPANPSHTSALMRIDPPMLKEIDPPLKSAMSKSDYTACCMTTYA